MDDLFHVEVREDGPYVTAQVSGTPSLENLKQVVDLVASESKRRGRNLFLIDLLQTGPPTREMDRFFIGEYAAARFHPGLKVAVVYRREWINKFGENTAVNRGATLKVVDNRGDALTWLLEGLPDNAGAGDARPRP